MLSAGLAVVVAVAVVLVALSQKSSSTVAGPVAPAPAGPVATGVAPGSTAQATTRPSTTTPPPTTTPAADDDQYWNGLLTDRSSQDETVLDARYDGRWVPQLSSKRAGLVADGITYRPVDIWNDYDVLSGAYPGALLLYSGAWSSFKAVDFWVTVAGTSYSTPEEANAWCDAQGIDPDHCFAKLLSHTSGTEGTTVLR